MQCQIIILSGLISLTGGCTLLFLRGQFIDTALRETRLPVYFTHHHAPGPLFSSFKKKRNSEFDNNYVWFTFKKLLNDNWLFFLKSGTCFLKLLLYFMYYIMFQVVSLLPLIMSINTFLQNREREHCRALHFFRCLCLWFIWGRY